MDRYGDRHGPARWPGFCDRPHGGNIILNAVEKGERGPQGIQGPQGSAGVMISPTEPTDPQIQVWIVDEGVYGENGALLNAGVYIRGEDGKFHPLQSIMGATPVKGVDYWTQADQDAMKQYIDETIHEAGGLVIDQVVTQAGTNAVSGAAVWAHKTNEVLSGGVVPVTGAAVYNYAMRLDAIVETTEDPGVGAEVEYRDGTKVLVYE